MNGHEPVFLPNDSNKTTRTTNKSCFLCRERRVRCDRTWPTCKRCMKRREDCEYGQGVSVETKNEIGDSLRVAELEAKLASVQAQLQATNGTSSYTTSNNNASSSSNQLYATPPSTTSSNNNGGPAGLGSGSGIVGGRPPSSAGGYSGSQGQSSGHSVGGLNVNVPASMSRPDTFPVSIHQTMFPQATNDETGVLLNFLFGQAASNFRLGNGSIDARLAAPQLAQSLTLHLLDASQYSCCSKLASFKVLSDKIPYLKSQLGALSPANQAAVVILCAIGARGSPHSALLGIDIPGLSDGTAPPSIYLTVGARRENACRALTDRAIDLCWYGRVIKDGSRENLEVLVGLSALLISAEVRPRKSRFILRNATGMFEDLQRSDELTATESLELRRSIASALFRDDAIHAAQLSQPPLISSFELEEYFLHTDQRIPDFGREQLSTILEQQLQTPNGEPLSLEALERAVNTVSVWVCFCQRTFARITTVRRPRAPSALGDLATLWRQIDTVHSSVQGLQQFIVSLDQAPPGSEGDPYVLDHYVLLAVLADTRLIDLVNLMHQFLMRQDLMDGWGGPPGTNQVETIQKMRVESDMRVRKVLKLSAFYSQLYLQSQDKHVVHHLFMQLDLLPSWTYIALQRVGSPGGPTSEEFEVSEEELEWFITALRLAVYYTPRAAVRLHELTTGRARLSMSSSDPSSGGTPALYHSPSSVSPKTPFANINHIRPPTASETNLNSLPPFNSNAPVPPAFPPVPLLPQTTDSDPGQLPFNLDNLEQFDIAPPPDLLHTQQRQQQQQYQQHHATQQQQTSPASSNPSPYFGHVNLPHSSHQLPQSSSYGTTHHAQGQPAHTPTFAGHQQHVFSYDPFPSPASGYPPPIPNQYHQQHHHQPHPPPHHQHQSTTSYSTNHLSNNSSGMHLDLPSPSLFVFDSYGYPKKSPIDAVREDPIAKSPGAQNAFKGQSWMNVAFTREFGELELPDHLGGGGSTSGPRRGG